MFRTSLLALAGIGSLIAASTAGGEVGTGVTVVAGAGGARASVWVQVAAQSTPGGVAGRFSVTGEGYFHDVEVRCIRTLSDRTIVGGVIVDSFNPVVIGHTSLVAVSDGGPGGVDWMNVAFSSTVLDTCPLNASTIPLNPLVHGNFVVK